MTTFTASIVMENPIHTGTNSRIITMPTIPHKVDVFTVTLKSACFDVSLAEALR